MARNNAIRGGSQALGPPVTPVDSIRIENIELVPAMLQSSFRPGEPPWCRPGCYDWSVVTVQAAGILVIVLLYTAFFLTGVRSGGSRSSSSSDSLLLANRNLHPVVCVLTLTATWVGGGYINGTAEAVYDSARGLLWAQAPWGYALSLILGGLFFAGRMRRQGFTTLLDLFDARYGKRIGTAAMVASLATIWVVSRFTEPSSS